MKNKRVLITGIAGFIGFHAAKALIKRGDAVFGVDNFNDYYSPTLKKARIASLDLPWIACDLNDASKMEKAIEEFAPTHILHLAAQAGVRGSLEMPHRYLDSNISGFVTLLECVKTRKIPVIYASSSSVYGLSEKMPLSESYRCDSPVSLYGATKKAGEEIAYCYHHLYQIPLTALRFFTVYGPWGRPDMAYYKFAKAIEEGHAIDVYNEGKLMRDFTYIDDIVAGTVAALDQSAPFEVYNLGNHRPVELMRFIEIIEEALGKKADKRFLPMQPGDVKETYADISHAQKDLGFAPKTPLEEGIPQFIEWYKSYSA